MQWTSLALPVAVEVPPFAWTRQRGARWRQTWTAAALPKSGRLWRRRGSCPVATLCFGGLRAVVDLRWTGGLAAQGVAMRAVLPAVLQACGAAMNSLVHFLALVAGISGSLEAASVDASLRRRAQSGAARRASCKLGRMWGWRQEVARWRQTPLRGRR